MATRKRKPMSRKTKPTAAAKERAGKPKTPLLLPKGTQLVETGQPGSKGRIDVTGIMPEDVRVDPDITEGHPGYEESGSSEIIPPERSAKERSEETRRSGQRAK